MRAESRLSAAAGVENLIIVETPDAVPVTHKDRSRAVNQVVDFLKAMQRDEYLVDERVYCSWGYYEELGAGESFLVMHIMIKPGPKHSLQMHRTRTDHWAVVSGTAKIARGDEAFLLSENESTCMPMGTKRRVENVGRMPLHMIEVQSGVSIDRNTAPDHLDDCEEQMPE